MSDISAGPGWWIASDGKWYPPELHPSVRGAHPGQIGGWEGPPTQQHHDQPDVGSDSHVGPRFPDLFQAAMQGSSYADTVSVKYDGGDERSGHPQPAGASATASGTRSPGSATADVGAGGSEMAVGAFTGASANKRRWHKGR
jgi:hypothetical protein